MASSIVGNLIVRLAADIGSYESGVRKAQKVTNRRMRKMEKRVRQWEDRTRRAAKAVGASFIAATTGLAYMSKAQIDAFRETDSLAQAIGVQVGQLQAYQYAAETVGVSGEKMGDILKDTADKIGDAYANGGGQALDIINNLGLSAEKLVHMSPDKQLLAIADALQSMPRAAQINALESLGNDASKLLPLLQDNARGLREATQDARDFGVAVSDVDASKLREASDQMTQLQGVAKGLMQQVAIGTTPAIKELTDTLTNPDVQQGITDMANALVTVIEKAASAISAVTGVTKSLAESLAADVHGAVIGDIDRLQGQIKRLEELRKTSTYNPQRYASFGDNGGLGYQNYISNDEIDQQLEKLRQRLKLSKEYQQSESDIAPPGPPGKTTVTGHSTWTPPASTSGSSDKPDDPYANQAQLIRESSEAITRALQKRQDAVDEVTQSLETQSERAWRLHQDRLKQINDNVINEQKAAELRSRSWQQYVQDISEGSDQISTFTTRAAENIQDELGDNLEDLLKGNFDGIVASWTQMLSQMAAQAAAANLNNALFGQDYDKSGEIGGLLGKIGSSIMGAFGGGSSGGAGFDPTSMADYSGISIPSIPGRATGGPTAAGGLYEVNEKGEPEMLTTGGRHYLLMGGMAGNVAPVSNANTSAATSSGGGAQVKVEVINQTGEETRTERTKGPNNEDLYRIFIGKFAKDVGRDNGPAAKALQGTYGLKRQGARTG